MKIATPYYYLAVMVLSIAFPFLLSFDKKVNFKQYFKYLIISLPAIALLFALGDVLYTYLGVWGFNEAYHLPYKIGGLPLEEIAFFLLVPYACVFIYEVLKAYVNLPKFQVSNNLVYVLVGGFLIISLVFKSHLYTSVTFLFTAIIVALLNRQRPTYTPYLFLAFAISIIPFVLVNGFLTGMFTPEPIVWYNNAENLGIRIFTIPLDDFSYSFNLLAMNIILLEELKKRF